jgi:predicted dehydrogenase
MRVGIIGLGFRLGYLARVFSECVPGFRIVAVVDPEPAGLATTQAHGIPLGRFFDSPQAMLEAQDLDLLMIGSPNHLHLDHLRLGLAAGCKIFCEKPVVTTMAETMELAALLATHPPDQVMVGLVLRYAPLYVDLRRAIADGQLGEVVSIEASEHIAPWHGAFFMRDWRRYQKYTGGFLLEKCCHDLDIYTAVMGCRPARVASFGGRKSFTPQNAPQGMGANDLSVYHQKPSGWQGSDRVFDSDADIVDFQTAIIEYASGAAMTFHTNLNVPDEFRRFCIMGAQGMAEGDFVRNFLRVHDARTGNRLVDRSYQGSALSHHNGADEQMARDIGAHVADGRPLPVSVIDALEAGLLAMTIDAARHGGTVVDMAPIWHDFDAALGRADGSAA